MAGTDRENVTDNMVPPESLDLTGAPFRIEGKLFAVALGPGDRLIVMLPREQAERTYMGRIKEIVQTWAGEIPVLVCSDDVKIGIVRAEGA